MAEQRQFKLPDGRTLAYGVFGANNGLPLIWFHGTPSGCRPPPSLIAGAKKRGVQIIAPQRPGYGDSTRHIGRKVVDMVADVQALTEHLGVKQCLVGGWSGGGPHALACAARLPGVLAALTIAGVAPGDAEDLDWLAGQGEDNIEEFDAAAKGEADLHKFCLAQRDGLLAGSVAEAVTSLHTLLSDVDRRACEGSDLGAFLVSSMRDGLRSGVDGWVDDDLQFTQPWGFSLDEVRVPILLNQGSEDRMVPYAHGVWLAEHLPEDKLRRHLIEGEGHVSLVAKGEELLDELIEVANVSGSAV